ncbi:hypothetical protein AVEN_66837-1 [Araneus ventricosus]|uniref:Uncharacterized protein n=1 Tax=Araneus ventricosus TaxID=182803 RepID=A0A4Y2DRN8_ARAVE|nr:hypothetical protein AVEN_66837-1 [Araneus ventricosus]
MKSDVWSLHLTLSEAVASVLVTKIMDSLNATLKVGIFGAHLLLYNQKSKTHAQPSIWRHLHDRRHEVNTRTEDGVLMASAQHLPQEERPVIGVKVTQSHIIDIPNREQRTCLLISSSSTYSPWCWVGGIGRILSNFI